jgi:hypothetical protein
MLDEPHGNDKDIAPSLERGFKTAAALEQTNVDLLTQSILAKAFRGDLVPQDPNDERASVLLERIRQTKDATEREETSCSSMRLSGAKNPMPQK